MYMGVILDVRSIVAVAGRFRIRRSTCAVALVLAIAAPAAAQGQGHDCLIEPRTKIKLATPVAGVLKRVPVDRGDAIRKGDLLAELESGVEKALLDLAQARAESDATIRAREARLTFLKRKWSRVSELRARDIASVQAFEEADADANVAAEELREAEFNRTIAKLDAVRAEEVLRQRSIFSPIDGVVAERNLVGGEYAYDQAPIMTIAQIDPLNVEVFVPIALRGAVVLGAKLKVVGEQPIGGTYMATVEVIDPIIDSRSSTFGIRLLLPNPDHKIPAGLRCKIEFPR